MAPTCRPKGDQIGFLTDDDLAVEGADKLSLVINLKTAKQLGIKIPESLLARADKIIE